MMSNNKQQTAVDWLIQELSKRDIDALVRELYKQAKEMEKEQMKEMYLKGIENYDPTFKKNI
jgi:phage tail tape-measure protein